jgi:hypothetical protein
VSSGVLCSPAGASRNPGQTGLRSSRIPLRFIRATGLTNPLQSDCGFGRRNMAARWKKKLSKYCAKPYCLQLLMKVWVAVSIAVLRLWAASICLSMPAPPLGQVPIFQRPKRDGFHRSTLCARLYIQLSTMHQRSVIPEGKPESSHMDVNAEVCSSLRTNASYTGKLPSMALDTGFPSGMTTHRQTCV